MRENIVETLYKPSTDFNHFDLFNISYACIIQSELLLIDIDFIEVNIFSYYLYK